MIFGHLTLWDSEAQRSFCHRISTGSNSDQGNWGSTRNPISCSLSQAPLAATQSVAKLLHLPLACPTVRKLCFSLVLSCLNWYLFGLNVWLILACFFTDLGLSWAKGLADHLHRPKTKRLRAHTRAIQDHLTAGYIEVVGLCLRAHEITRASAFGERGPFRGRRGLKEPPAEFGALAGCDLTRFNKSVNVVPGCRELTFQAGRSLDLRMLLTSILSIASWAVMV